MKKLKALSLILAICSTSLSLVGQEQTAPENEREGVNQSFSNLGSPPDFVPPPPPNFNPPPAPSGATASRQQAARNQQTIPTEEQLLQRESDLVDESDPEMAAVVGMIRIPEMGTNEVLEMLETFTGKPILRQQTLPSVKITFFSQGPLTRAQAITAIESLLALNGIAITSLGEDFLKAVPSAIINNQVARVWEGSTLDAVPSQTIYEKIFELDFLSTEEAAQLLQPLMTQGAPIAFDKSNLILITDSLINLQRIERLLPILDRPAKLKTEMLFFELQNIGADDVSQRFDQLIAGPLRRQLQGNTTIEADERTNQLLIFTHPGNAQLVTELIERLDIDVAPTTDTNVYSIRYAEATEVVNIIEQIISGQREVRQDTAGGSGNTPNPAAAAAARDAANQTRRNNQTVAQARAEATNLQFSDFLTIVPDERANTIVANGTHSDLRYLEQLIEQIDSLLAQVRIEVVIVDVTLSEDDVRGIDTFNFGYTGTGFDVDFEDPNSTWNVGASDDPISYSGAEFGVSWGPDEAFSFNFILQSVNQNSNARVLSAPTIVTTHNKEAIVSVGEERPVITSVTTSTNTIGTGTDTGFVGRESVQYRDVKLELKVTPLIGSDGVVQMEIEQTVQNVLSTVEVNRTEQPVIGTRNATSYVSVRDGGLIALGGLQSYDRSNNKSRMAILGRIPVLGDLFSRTSDQLERRELLIFIRPTIIRNTDDANTDANKLINNMEGTKEIKGYLEKGTFREDEPEETEEERVIPRRYQ